MVIGKILGNGIFKLLNSFKFIKFILFSVLIINIAAFFFIQANTKQKKEKS